MIRRQPLLVHAKAVTTLRVHMQLDGIAGGLPLRIRGDTARRGDRIVGGAKDEYRRGKRR